jgi:hypothetical protein
MLGQLPVHARVFRQATAFALALGMLLVPAPAGAQEHGDDLLDAVRRAAATADATARARAVSFGERVDEALTEAALAPEPTTEPGGHELDEEELGLIRRRLAAIYNAMPPTQQMAWARSAGSFLRAANRQLQTGGEDREQRVRGAVGNLEWLLAAIVHDAEWTTPNGGSVGQSLLDLLDRTIEDIEQRRRRAAEAARPLAGTSAAPIAEEEDSDYAAQLAALKQLRDLVAEAAKQGRHPGAALQDLLQDLLEQAAAPSLPDPAEAAATTPDTSTRWAPWDQHGAPAGISPEEAERIGALLSQALGEDGSVQPAAPAPQQPQPQGPASRVTTGWAVQAAGSWSGQAEQAWREALEARNRGLGTGDPDQAAAVAANVQGLAGQAEQSAANARHAADVVEAKEGPDAPATKQARADQARAEQAAMRSRSLADQTQTKADELAGQNGDGGQQGEEGQESATGTTDDSLTEPEQPAAEGQSSTTASALMNTQDTGDGTDGQDGKQGTGFDGQEQDDKVGVVGTFGGVVEQMGDIDLIGSQQPPPDDDAGKDDDATIMLRPGATAESMLAVKDDQSQLTVLTNPFGPALKFTGRPDIFEPDLRTGTGNDIPNILDGIENGGTPDTAPDVIEHLFDVPGQQGRDGFGDFRDFGDFGDIEGGADITIYPGAPDIEGGIGKPTWELPPELRQPGFPGGDPAASLAG